MLGERRDQTTAGEEGGRAKSAERKKMWIRLAIESNEFHTFSDNLRVHGIIEEAKFDHGSHHTHLVEVGDEIELTSQSGFPLVDRELISDAVSSSGKPKVAIIVVENDEAILFEITGRGIREVHTWTRRGGGKYTAIGIGMWLGLIMAFNVWFIIWPNQKKVLGIVEATPEEKPAAAKKALIASRTNTLLSLPMLLSMVAAQNLY